MIEHNVVSAGGFYSKAVGFPKGLGVSACELCSLNTLECRPCTPRERNDGEDVIYKLHYRPKYNELPIKVIEL